MATTFKYEKRSAPYGSLGPGLTNLTRGLIQYHRNRGYGELLKLREELDRQRLELQSAAHAARQRQYQLDALKFYAENPGIAGVISPEYFGLPVNPDALTRARYKTIDERTNYFTGALGINPKTARSLATILEYNPNPNLYSAFDPELYLAQQRLKQYYEDPAKTYLADLRLSADRGELSGPKRKELEQALWRLATTPVQRADTYHQSVMNTQDYRNQMLGLQQARLDLEKTIADTNARVNQAKIDNQALRNLLYGNLSLLNQYRNLYENAVMYRSPEEAQKFLDQAMKTVNVINELLSSTPNQVPSQKAPALSPEEAAQQILDSILGALDDGTAK